MNLGPTELARLLVFQVAEMARRNRAAGLSLNAPEAIAIACDEMHVAARAGASFEEVHRAGYRSVTPDDLMEGVADLISEIRLEVLLAEGSRLIVLRDLGRAEELDEPAAPRRADAAPGATRLGDGAITLNAGLGVVEIEVHNTSDHLVRVSSHFPFDRVQARLVFDREVAAECRLDIPAGDTVRWGPGETKTVRLVRISTAHIDDTDSEAGA